MKHLRCTAILLLLTWNQDALAAVRVELTSLPPGPSSICYFGGDDMHLSVLVGGRRIAARSFCSAYGRGSARVVTDARGRAYVLLDYSVGHGSHVARDLLAIYRVDKRLVRRGTLISRDPIGPDAEASYHYAIKMPRSGGLEFIGSRKVTGQRTALDSTPLPPTRLRIDMR